MLHYIWESPVWPKFSWQSEVVQQALSQARHLQCRFLSRINGLGLQNGLEGYARLLEDNVVHSAAIEGHKLDRQGVRSSVALHLNLPSCGLRPADRAADGLVEVMLDVAHRFNDPLTEQRVWAWHAALFPTGYSGMCKIHVGAWRCGPVQVLSGGIGHETVHYQGPPAEHLADDMQKFFAWWEESRHTTDGLIRAALAHLYFVSLHPFDDGNGRIARALTDLALAQEENIDRRYYSFASQIMQERKEYYEILQKTQRGKGDCTEWLVWFMNCFYRAVKAAEKIFEDVLCKAEFWQLHRETALNERQRKVLNRLLDAGRGSFEGGLSTQKYRGISKTSRATAWRDIDDLLQKNMLRPLPGGGRSTAYEIVWPEIPNN